MLRLATDAEILWAQMSRHKVMKILLERTDALRDFEKEKVTGLRQESRRLK